MKLKWSEFLLLNLRITLTQPCTLLCENEPAIAPVKGPSPSQSSTHLIHLTLYCDFVMRGDFLVGSVPADDPFADLYTTQLGPGPYTWHCGCFYVIDSLSLPVVLVLFCCHCILSWHIVGVLRPEMTLTWKDVFLTWMCRPCRPGPGNRGWNFPFVDHGSVPVNIPFPDHGSAAVNIPSFGL